MHNRKSNFCQMSTFLSFLIFSALLGEPSTASDYIKVEYITI